MNAKKAFLLCFSLFAIVLQAQQPTPADPWFQEISKSNDVDLIKGKPIVDRTKEIVIDGFGDVTVNGKKEFKYKRFDEFIGKEYYGGEFVGSAFGIYKKNEKDILFTSKNFTVQDENGKSEYLLEFEFPTIGKRFLSRKPGVGSWLFAIKLMLYKGVIDIKGNIDPNAMNAFIEEFSDVDVNSYAAQQIAFWRSSKWEDFRLQVKQAIVKDFEEIKASNPDVYGYAIISGESYQVNSMYSAFSKRSDESSPSLIVSDWEHVKKEGPLDELGASIKEQNAEFKQFFPENKYAYLDANERMLIASYQQAVLAALMELREEGFFEDIFLTIWLEDGRTSIIPLSVKALNSKKVVRKFEKAYR